MTLRPIVAGSVTLTSAAALVLLNARWAGSAYGAALIATLLVLQTGSNAKAGRRLLAWTIPFVAPLIILHGVLNAAYPVSFSLFDVIPVRNDGLSFGYDVAVRVVILSTVGAYWLSLDRDEFVEALLRIGLPSSIVMVGMQGLVMARLLQHRIDAVFLAQRARGIPVGASFLSRLRSLPALLVPVVVGTFIEAEARIPVLLSHGYGRTEPTSRPAPALSTADRLLILWPLVLLGAAAIWDANS